MDKATPTPPPATVNGVMALVREYASLTYSSGMAQARGQASGSSLWPEQYNALRAEVERLAAQAAPTERDAKDAARYRLLRRGQKWSTVDGIGTVLRAETLDAAIDAAIAKD